VPIVSLHELQYNADTDLLGRGGFKAVYKAQWRGQAVALSLWLQRDAVNLNELEAEARLMYKLSHVPGVEHHRVVPVLGIVAEHDKIGLISELMSCSLYEAIHGRSEADQRHVAAHAGHGACHGMGFANPLDRDGEFGACIVSPAQ
jgi:serine/threonine protein kinase